MNDTTREDCLGCGHCPACIERSIAAAEEHTPRVRRFPRRPTNPAHDPAVPHADPRVHGSAQCEHRCGTCSHGEHHWIDAGFDPTDPEEEDAQAAAILAYDREHGTEHAMAHYACKHCAAWAECEFIWEQEEDDAEDES